MATELSLENLKFKFTALINNMDLSLNIKTINVESVTVVSSTFGHLSGLALKVEINNGMRIGIPILNTVLAHY